MNDRDAAYDRHSAPAIAVEGLRKRFGDVVALDGIDFAVPAGTVLGLLGPNGAGKTTTVRVLTTTVRPDAGRASVLGVDVMRHPAAVRARIGLAGQYAAVDDNLTGRENLRMMGKLAHLPRTGIAARGTELLERFDLVDAADRTVRTYSGGMRRRLDLGASLVGRPRVLFLDEPTTGLDPRSRIGLWEVIEQLVDRGTTLLLTTQYLEEADKLADAIAVIDHGRVIAEGTADELKSQVGGDVLELVVVRREQLKDAVTAISPLTCGEPQLDEDTGQVRVPVRGGATVLAEAVRHLDAAAVAIADLALHRPTLDDVFLALTGRAAAADAGVVT